MELSIISPVYKAEKIVPELVTRIIDSIEKLTPNFEIILVDDCGPDGSWNKIKEECKKDQRVKGIKLSRNFGQHYAITAGLTLSKGNWVVVMDCDLQDLPEEIIRLYYKAIEGCDIVLAKREVRQDNFFKRISSLLFYKVFSYLTNTKQNPEVANFGIYNRKVIDSVLSMGDQVRFFPTMVQWVGFKKEFLKVKHAARFEGTSSYNWNKLFKLAFDNILAFSNKPLQLTIRLGLTISVFSIVFGIYYLYSFFTGRIKVIGFASLIISISFFSGIIIFILGILGLYIGKLFDKIKERPNYIIDEIADYEGKDKNQFS